MALLKKAELTLTPEAALLPDELVDVPLDTLEEAAIIRSMHRHKGNTKRVSEALGVSIRKIQYRAAQYRKDGRL